MQMYEIGQITVTASLAGSALDRYLAYAHQRCADKMDKEGAKNWLMRAKDQLETVRVLIIDALDSLEEES